MKVYTYSEARQGLASLLEEAQKEGAVRIRRRDGQRFIVKPERSRTSPLDVKGVKLHLSTREIGAFIREARRKTR